MNVKKAVIPIAGKGTRFLPVTKAIPKEMIPILARPMIDYVIDEVIASGIEEVIFITSEGREITEGFYSPSTELEEFLDNAGKEKEKKIVEELGRKIRIKSVIQKEQLGLGHAIYQAKELIGDDEAFAVLLPDDITLGHETPVTAQLLELANEKKASVIGVMKVPKDKVHLYGVIKYSEQLNERSYKLVDMVEKPSKEVAPSFLATPGRYILTNEIFEHLEKIPRGAGGEFQLTDAISSLCKTQAVYAYEFSGDRYDTGSVEGYLKATIDFALKDPKLSQILRSHLDEVL